MRLQSPVYWESGTPGGTPSWNFTADTGVWDAYADELPHLQWEHYGPAPTIIDISGLVNGLGSGISIGLSVEGDTAVTVSSGAGGTFSFTSVSVNGDDQILVFVNDASYKTNLIGTVPSSPVNFSRVGPPPSTMSSRARGLAMERYEAYAVSGIL